MVDMNANGNHGNHHEHHGHHDGGGHHGHHIWHNSPLKFVRCYLSFDKG